MDTDVREPLIVKGGENMTLGVNGMESPKTVLLEASEEEEVEEEDDMESYSLLGTETRRGGMSRSGEKRRLSVQWSDANGNKLAEILEFQPRPLIRYLTNQGEISRYSNLLSDWVTCFINSEASDSEEDESDACFCCIM